MISSAEQYFTEMTDHHIYSHHSDIFTANNRYRQHINIELHIMQLFLY